MRDLLGELQIRCSLRVSRSSLARYLRERLGATFRLVKPITKIQNMTPARMQRQYAAARFIEALHEGLRIINIDESVIRWTDHRKRGWVPKNRKNQVTDAKSLLSVNIIAAMCCTGEVLYTVNCGMTNSQTFCLFLVKLVEFFDAQDSHWRKKSVILLDNATYHRSSQTRAVIE